MLLSAIAALSLAAAPAAGDLQASPLEQAPRRPDHPRGTGEVAYATAERAYLDVGAAEGVAAGTAVRVRRGGAAVGSCSVDLVAEHQAACPARGLRAGDAVTYDAAPEAPAPKPLPAVVSDDELARRAALVEAAPAPARVEHRATVDRTRSARAVRHVVASVGGATWSASGADASSVAAVDLWIRDAELAGGLRLDADLRAERWIPDATPRFRPDDRTRLYVWQLQLTRALSAATFSAGRILPLSIPGATVFDGAVASLRSGSLELGLFGGAVPEPDTLAFGTDRSTGGAFWSYRRALGAEGGFRQDGRIAVVDSPETGTRFEATLGGRAWLKAAALSAEVQLGTGGTLESASHVDAVRVDATARALGALSFGAGWRHTGLDWPRSEPSLYPGRGDAADGFVAWDVWVLRIAATGGFSRDAVTDLDRRWFGPEIAVPRLLGSRLGLVAGYLEELGWLEGRSAYARLHLRAADAVTLTAGGSWVHETTLGADQDEVGLSLGLAASLGPHLGLRVYALSRVPISGEEAGGGSARGITVNGALSATF